jgi:glycosyltransferase involved in cell wall biosynthesis
LASGLDQKLGKPLVIRGHDQDSGRRVRQRAGGVGNLIGGQLFGFLERAVGGCFRQDRVGVVVELFAPTGGGEGQKDKRGEAAHGWLRNVGESLSRVGMVRQRRREYDGGSGVLIAMAEPAVELLTVAIPFFKGQGYLRKAIESVLQQSSPHWGLIVCDDGPELGTAELVASFADPRMRYLRNDRNLGMAGNWNRCLDVAETDLVNLLHNDDELLPNYVAEMLKAGREHPDAAAFFCRAKVIDTDGRDVISVVDSAKRLFRPKGRGPLILHGPSAVEALARGNFIMCPTVCYRKSRLGRQRFDPSWTFVLDLEFSTRLLLAGETIVGLPEVAFAYRRHDENATAAYTESLTRFDEECELLDQLAKTASERGWAKLKEVASAKRVVRWHLLYRIVRDLIGMRFRPAARKWSFWRRLVGKPTLNHAVPDGGRCSASRIAM